MNKTIFISILAFLALFVPCYSQDDAKKELLNNLRLAEEALAKKDGSNSRQLKLLKDMRDNKTSDSLLKKSVDASKYKHALDRTVMYNIYRMKLLEEQRAALLLIISALENEPKFKKDHYEKIIDLNESITEANDAVSITEEFEIVFTVPSEHINNEHIDFVEDITSLNSEFVEYYSDIFPKTYKLIKKSLELSSK